MPGRYRFGVRDASADGRGTRARAALSCAMTALGLPEDDEPFDFRRQAATYARFRRDYSATLYDAIEARTGPAGRRVALDLGCGTGFVTASLARRGWRAIGVDFSAPMLGAARETSPDAVLVRARAEAQPVRAGRAALVTAGTAFHWMAPAPTVAEIARVLAPGGWCAIFWRLSVREAPPMQLVGEVLARVGVVVPEGLPGALASPVVFAGSPLVAEPEIRLETTLDYTADDFHGAVSTVEWLRRVAGPLHGRFLDELRAELPRRFPDGVRDPCEEFLVLARRA
jgi:SAM-dependent methyltransferase